jgi:poly(A) polymerase
MEDSKPTPSPPSGPCQDGPDAPVILSKGEHPISRKTIDPDVFKIINRLVGRGFIAYLVGGAVRDLMLGRTPLDFDLVTDARPGQIKKIFPSAFVIGRRFRLAHIHFRGGKFIEVATFRKEVPPAREAEAALQTAEPGGAAEPQNEPAHPAEPTVPPDIYGTPREDACRRDITINALFFDVITSTVIDYVGGLADLRHRVVRVIGEPAERFTEDPVRIWRAIRHAARLEFKIDGATEQMIPRYRHLLAKCASARLFEELNNDLESKTRPVFEALQRYGLLRYILGKIGERYESDQELWGQIGRLLEINDQMRSLGVELSRDEAYALLFWPWTERLLSGAKGDVPKILKDAMAEARMPANLPRTLSANVIQIMVIAEHMTRALRTGRMRWSLKRRSHFPQASRLCVIIEKGRPPEPDESFESLYRQAFPSGFGFPRGGRRGRRRRRRPAPASF